MHVMSPLRFVCVADQGPKVGEGGLVDAMPGYDRFLLKIGWLTQTWKSMRG